MARSRHYKGNDDGGYGNPPVSHQFKGKPGPGRPKGSKSIDGALRKTFGKKVVRVDKSGKRTFIAAPEALAERALELGLKGPLRANVEARKLAEKYGPQEDQPQLDPSKCTHAELELYLYICNKLMGHDFKEELTPRAERIITRLTEIIEEETEAYAKQYWEELQKPNSLRSKEFQRIDDPDKPA